MKRRADTIERFAHVLLRERLSRVRVKERAAVHCEHLATNTGWSQPIDWAPDRKAASVQDVGIYHRRADVRMAEQLLHGPNVISRLEQVRRERVPIMPRAA